MRTYFISNNVNSYIKIGISKNPELRIKQIAGQCNFIQLKLLFSVEGNYEKLLHEYYNEYRKQGEWFEIEISEENINNIIKEHISSIEAIETPIIDNTIIQYDNYLINKAKQYSPVDYVALYPEIIELAKLSGAEQSTFHILLKYLVYNTNEIILTSSRRKQICILSNLKYNTVNASISKLNKKGVIIKINGRIHLNPKYAFFGDQDKRNGILYLLSFKL